MAVVMYAWKFSLWTDGSNAIVLNSQLINL